MINFSKVKTFEGGLSTDLTDNIEKKNTFQKSSGGRLYSKNGVFSFSGGAGSKLIYSNDKIVKYLGFYPFEDEFVVFAKCSYPIDLNPTTELEFDNNYTCDKGESGDIDFGEYYGENDNVPNYLSCNTDIDVTPINNLEYNDCIITFSLDDNYNLVGVVQWVGQQNWPLNGKISTDGVFENQFYKRVYYTDAVNQKRVVNLKDTSLASRSGDEFNQILNNVLLQPEINTITIGGQLKCMKVLYVYRVISANGQLSEFSPSSFYASILSESEAIEFKGGDVSEVTNKRVEIKCNIVNPEDSSEIECIALEYEAYGPPTAIRNLGRKSASSIVYFDHYGTEAEFADNVTYNDVINYTNTWKYCNDFSSKKNKLIAGGLRNEPFPTEINNLEYLFPLHSWKADGSTHDCLINPEPWEYRYIDPSNTEDLIYIKEKVYRNISSFGPITMRLLNKETAEFIWITFSDLTLDSYTDITSLVLNWLLEQKSTDTFLAYFPNLDIADVQGQLLFKPIDSLIKTDISNYVFYTNNEQYIENFDNNIVFLPVAINTSNLVFGAQSIGFNKGTGIRVTYREFKEPLLNQADSVYDGTGKLLDYSTPSMDKFCMKGEIYRLGFQAYNNDSTRYFTIPLGDVMIPDLGALQSSIDDDGNIIITSDKYVNQSVENGILYGHGIKMHIEVRLSCELQKVIPMYQMVYVERTETDRTILCQGIAAPLQRVQDSGGDRHRMPDDIRNKWTLPYYGGPVYEKNGFWNYDSFGENYQYTDEAASRRVMAHRRLMYFDSPDLYFNKISDQYVESSEVHIVGKLNTDHTENVIMEHGGDLGGGANYGDEVYPKFSRKILENQIQGETNVDGLPRYVKEEDETYSQENFFYNVSVYSNFTSENKKLAIDKAKELLYGEVISGAAFDTDNDVSNNAFGLPVKPWFYSEFAREWHYTNDNPERPTCDLFGQGAMTSPGYKTMILKTVEDLFTDEFCGAAKETIDSQIRLGGWGNRNGEGFNHGITYDTVPLINLFRNNREGIYGGRSEQAYSKNTYIPLSRTIPTLRSSNNSQFFDVGTDVHISLNIRTKNDWGEDEIKEIDFHNSGTGLDSGSIETWTRNAAWAYAVVLEVQVEPKLSSSYEFYREGLIHNFDISRDETINGAYLNENTLKSYIPKPYKFRDDPNQENVIAVSNVKLSGEYFDSWTVFKVNNFYSLLERNKGYISNFVKQNEELFAIQEQQTSLIYIGTDRIITDSQGSPINVQQGSGTVVDGHKVISSYGTSIRRSVSESPDFGFTFFDERKIELVKIKEPLLLKHLLHISYFNRFKNNKIIDTECYFDIENKETCVRIRTEKGDNFVLSYNELDKVFNGEFPYDNDIYMLWDEKVYSPITNLVNDKVSSEALHQLNQGDILNFFGVQHDLKIGFYVNADIDKVFQYKNIGIITSLEYPIKEISCKSNLGYDRVILGTHNWYKIREGTHTVPMINETNDVNECSDVRGAWVYLEITAQSLNKNKVDILAVLNDLRYSHQ